MHSMSTEEWHAFVTCGAPTARPGGPVPGGAADHALRLSLWSDGQDHLGRTAPHRADGRGDVGHARPWFPDACFSRRAGSAARTVSAGQGMPRFQVEVASHRGRSARR